MSLDTVQIEDADIAIIGMAAQLPGARDVSEYWTNLCAGVEAIRPVSDDDLLARGEIRSRLRDPNYVRATAYLAEYDGFDAEFFGLSPKEAAIMDPQHRKFLETCWNALEDAAHMPEDFNGPVGVYAGCGMGSYFYWNVCSNRDLVDNVGHFLLRHTGNDKDFLSTRVSHVFDLTGPSVNVQTACSTSLVAIHMASQSLLSGECDMALAGGVTIELPHGLGYLYKENEILSPDGHCHAFDHRAQGTVFGSGAAVLVLRRLRDALADGDHIWAVIKGSAINNDGAAKAGYLAPSVEGQAQAISEALVMSGVPSETVTYVECHGTGTALGDPIEVAALNQAFARMQDGERSEPCLIGSVKTNIGHLDTAAGGASVIKTALALHHGTIPPSLAFEKPNPAIDFEGGPFAVAARLTDWASPIRRAGVNSLGVGGTNAHAVLQQPPVVPAAEESDWPFHIVTVSGRSKAALDANAQALAGWLRGNPDVNMADLSFTLTHGRRRFDRRRVLVARDGDEAAGMLANPDPQLVFDQQLVAENAEVVFMMPGGGAQYAGMARDLYATEPVFRDWMDRGLDQIAKLEGRDIRDLWLPDEADRAEADRRLLQPSLQLPLLMVTEYALAQLWMSWGVQPAALIGHSMGENTAAALAGVMSFEDCIGLVHLRGRLFDSVPPGGMLSLDLPPEGFAAELGPDLDLAAVNAPALSVVSGPDAALDAFAARMAAKGVEAQRIAISIAAHSRMLEGILAPFRDYLAGIPLNPPKIPIISNRTGAPMTAEEATSPDYWVAHLRGTVHFADGIAHLARVPGRVFLEVGPGRAMKVMAQSHPDISANQVISTLRHRDHAVGDDVYFMLGLARIWAAGVPIDWSQIWGGIQRRRLSLPGYQFQRKRYFVERATTEATVADTELERIADPAEWGWRPVWQLGASGIEIDASGVPVVYGQQTFLIFADEDGLGEAVADRLRALGQSVAVVLPGDRFHDRGEGRFTLPPEGDRESYEMLLAALAGQGAVPSRILHLWSAGGEGKVRPGSSLLNTQLERGFFSLLHLGQALASEMADAPVDLIAVASDALSVSGEAAGHPEKATIAGPLRVLPHEQATIATRLVDLRLPPQKRGKTADPKIVSQLLEELLSPLHGADTVALRGDRRFVLNLKPAPLPDAAIADFGVTFITGGFGGIGQTIARDLARKGGAKLVLTTRSALGSAWVTSSVAELEAAGAEVLAVQAEVTSADDLREAFAAARQRFGRIDTLIHAAGITRDALIAAKSDDDAWDVLAPKLLGTRALADALDGQPVMRTVLFSSTSSVIGAAGQADYVAANEYLNAVARARPAVFGTTTAINWGIWADAGMAARAAGSEAAPLGQMRDLTRPLLDNALSTANGQQFQKLLRHDDWIIDGHRTADGKALLPGTGSIELIAEAAAEAGMPLPFAIRELEFQRPIRVADGGATLVTIRLKPEGEALRVTIHDDPQSEPNVTALIGASAEQGRVIPPPTDWQQDGNGLALPSAQESQMRFGPEWQVLRRFTLAEGQGAAELTLDRGLRAEGYILHPALLDIATGWAMQLIDGWRPDHLWAPMGYRRITVHAPLGAQVFSHIRNAGPNSDAAGMAEFDIDLTGPDGALVAEIRGFALRKLTDGFGTAPAQTVAVRPQSPAEKRLYHNISQGIPAEVGPKVMAQALALGLPQVFVSSLDLPGLIAEAALPEPGVTVDAGFERPDLDSDFVAPADGLETELAAIWSDLLGIAEIGAADSFFDLGGHSLIAVRMFAQVRKTVGVDLPISTLFEAPTIAQLAALIAPRAAPREATGERGLHVVETAADRPARRFVVDMGGRDVGTPFFMVAGMFGNVMNLRQLAQRVGADRKFYGLQARGLFGEDKPHDNFEDAARDYLVELREVQPNGPYLLGGFSGGGLIALEMARLLQAEGEEVAQLVLLDTPLPLRPELTKQDKLLIRLTEMREQGPSFVGNWVRNKVGYRQAMRERAAEGEGDAGSFHDRAIEASFRAALPKVKLMPWDGPVTMFRPPLDHRFKVSGGRWVTTGREYLLDDNGWSDWMPQLQVIEVPGNHDSMVLEPNVRRMASVLRRVLQDADDANAQAEAAE